LLADGHAKNEALMKATESTALEVHREAEAAAKKLFQEAMQKAADTIRTAQNEAEEIRRRTHNAEIGFLKEKNSGLAELKLMVDGTKAEAQKIVSAAMKQASDVVYKAEQEAESKIVAANNKISAARKSSEKEVHDHIKKTLADLDRKTKEQEAQLARKQKEWDSVLAQDRKRVEEETRGMLNNARERADAIMQTAEHGKNYKLAEVKAAEAAMFHVARQTVATITGDAEQIALRIVEEARARAQTIEKRFESIVTQAHAEAAKIKAAGEAYSEKIKREVPDPAAWQSELATVRRQEQERLQALIEPTVKNYLRAIDKVVAEILVSLPSKYHSNKAIQDFVSAITNIQRKKDLMKFADMVPKDSGRQSPTSLSHPPLKRSS